MRAERVGAGAGRVTPERGPGITPPGRPTLIYDGECGLCRSAVATLVRWDREHRIALVAFQDREQVARFGIALPALAAAMHLVLPDGRVLAGADAVPELLRRLPGRRWMAWAFALPGARPLARRVYRWIAARRHCLVRGRPQP
ncbi:MAG: thiol-disulfide oxidoreductase DCC family protein [Gemmatimonadales bacterium]